MSMCKLCRKKKEIDIHRKFKNHCFRIPKKLNHICLSIHTVSKKREHNLNIWYNLNILKIETTYLLLFKSVLERGRT